MHTAVIAGPTSVGKTSLGLRLAKKYNAEIISADSRQVYRYLDIGTGKDVGDAAFFDKSNTLLHDEHDGFTLGYYLVDSVPIWLLDVVEPDQQFTVADFVRLSTLIVEDLRSREKNLFIVGGSGFYIKGLVQGYDTMGVPPDSTLRRELETQDLDKLQRLVADEAPERWKQLNQSDRQNPRRLIRAVEVARSPVEASFETPALDTLVKIFLTADRSYLDHAIDERVDARVQVGMFDELDDVLSRGYSWTDPGLDTLGYQQLAPYFDGEKTKDQVIDDWKTAERQYARKQLGWFKKSAGYRKLDVTRPGYFDELRNEVKQTFT